MLAAVSACGCILRWWSFLAGVFYFFLRSSRRMLLRSSFKDSQSMKHRLAEGFRLMIGTGSDLDLYIIREQKPELVQTHAQQASFGDAILQCQSTQLCEQQVDSKRILF